MELLDMVIVGGGAAGLTAAVYARRAGLSFVMLDIAASMGSQLTQTDEVENYTGLGKISGMELIMKFREHAESMGAQMSDESVKTIAKADGVFTVTAAKNTYTAKTLVYCAGASHRPLGVPGEAELSGRGVSCCAVCDGFFCRNKTALIVGGGDTAVSEALYLAKICKQVYLVHRRGEFRAAKALTDRLLECENVTCFMNAELAVISGESRVTSVTFKDGRSLDVDGVFVAVGIVPNSQLLQPLAECDSAGFVKAGESGATSCEGLFVAGDVRTKPLRQIITACADGANAVNSAVEYLNR